MSEQIKESVSYKLVKETEWNGETWYYVYRDGTYLTGTAVNGGNPKLDSAEVIQKKYEKALEMYEEAKHSHIPRIKEILFEETI